MTSTLSGSRKPSALVHAADAEGCFTLCGHGIDANVITGPSPGFPVACKRCLASLARKDREFRRKSNESIRGAMDADAYVWTVKDEAARAIAREEGH